MDAHRGNQAKEKGNKTKKHKLPSVTDRQLAIILNALRNWECELQDFGDGHGQVSLLFNDCDDADITAEEVDELCGHLNFG